MQVNIHNPEVTHASILDDGCKFATAHMRDATGSLVALYFNAPSELRGMAAELALLAEKLEEAQA